jgi:glutamate transport system substrate-binding protein
MRLTHARIAAAAASTMLVLAACGDAGEDEDAPAAPDVEVADEDFPAGTTMADLQEAGKITIGVKYDQPGHRLQEAGDGGAPRASTVEMGKILAAGLGIAAEGHRVEGDDLRQP